MSVSTSPYSSHYSNPSSVETDIPNGNILADDVMSLLSMGTNGYVDSLMNPNEPYVTIIEQPMQRGVRFRYASEGSSHGGLPGAGTNGNKRTYPSIKIHNYQGPAKVDVQLVCEDDWSLPHPHDLVGKNCRNGICSVEYKGDSRMEITFPGLAIRNVTKKKKKEALVEKLRSWECDRKQNINYNLEDSLSADELTAIEKKAEALSKTVQLNAVRLMFSVALLNARRVVTHLLLPVYSEPIYDSKSATATSLKICRMSKTSGIVTGGEEVFLFCEKVQREDISVVFAELNPENQVIWESFGEFGPNDVHHQFGIAFRTPSYSNPNISEPVTVQVSLKRPSDGEMSEPIEYRFTPVPLDPESTQRKRKKAMPRFALVPISAVSGGASVMSTSTINSIPLNMGSFGITNGQMPIFLNSMTGSIMTPGHKNTVSVRLNHQGVIDDNGGHRPKYEKVQSDDAVPNYSEVLSTTDTDALDDPRKVSSSAGDAILQKLQKLRLDDFEEPLPAPARTTEGLKKPTKESQRTQSIPPGSVKPSVPGGIASAHLKDLKEIGEDFDSGFTQSGLQSLVKDELTSGLDTASPTVQGPQAKTQGSTGTVAPGVGQTGTVVDPRLVQWIAERVIEQMVGHTVTGLQNYASSGDTAYLVAAHRHLVASQNQDGDNMIHLAVINKHVDVLRSILDAVKDLPEGYSSGKDDLNNLLQTPLHLAIYTNEEYMVELLVDHGADLTVKDRHGNTPVHMAAERGNDRCLRILIANSKNSKTTPATVVNMLNHAGYSPLHLAVRAVSLPCLKLLMSISADVDLPDTTSGYTALHLATDLVDTGIVGYLVIEAGADIDKAAYNGNTALHIAVGKDLPGIAALLVSAGASVDVENSENAQNGGDSEEETVPGEGEERRGITPRDLAGGNPKMMRILNGESYRSVMSNSVSPDLSVYGRHPSAVANKKDKLDVLDPVVRDQLAQILDINHWKTLALNFDLGRVITEVEIMPRPTVALLDQLEALDVTVSQLCEKLLAMQLQSAVQIIKDAVTSYHNLNTGDVGSGDGGLKNPTHP